MLILTKQLPSNQDQLSWAVCWIFCVIGIWVQVLPFCNVDEGICGSSLGSLPKWVSLFKELNSSPEEKPVPVLNKTSIAIRLKVLM